MTWNGLMNKTKRVRVSISLSSMAGQLKFPSLELPDSQDEGDEGTTKLAKRPSTSSQQVWESASNVSASVGLTSFGRAGRYRQLPRSSTPPEV